MAYKFEKTNCTICQSSDYELISKKGEFNIPLNVVICKNCGLVYLNPRWREEDYIDFYKNEYDTYYRVENPKSLQTDSTNIILNRLKKNNLLPKDVKNILDIGSGEGENLLALKKSYPDSSLFAIEPSIKAQNILHLKGVKVLSNDVNSEWDQNLSGNFDIVIMRHVLEHFLNPVEVLKKVHNILSENSIVYIAVPNALNPTVKVERKFFRAVHTYYYNKHSLKNLLRLTNLKPKIIVEGDEYEKGEVFLVAGKTSTSQKISFDKDYYHSQKKVLLDKIKDENMPLNKLKSFCGFLYEKVFT